MNIPSMWKAVLNEDVWQVLDKNGDVVATITTSLDEEAQAKLIASSPYMLEALKAVIEIMGGEDLPDNGEYNGGAVSDLVRSAVLIAEGYEY